MTLALEMGSRERRKEAPVRVQGGAAGGLDLGGIDRGGDMGLICNLKVQQKAFADGLVVGVKQRGGVKGKCKVLA